MKRTQHPVTRTIEAEGFTPLGWFAPDADDGVPGLDDAAAAGIVMLVGNAGPAMFERFARKCDPSVDQLDDWSRARLTTLAQNLGAHAVFPFDKPPLPFLRWAQKAGCGHPSKLGMNIHPEFGLWHAFRAAFVFAENPDLPVQSERPHPCDTCPDQPCLSACPVAAFDTMRPISPYDVDRCVAHLASPEGSECLGHGCKARLACPVGASYRYREDQMQFHLSAFLRARTNEVDRGS